MKLIDKDKVAAEIERLENDEFLCDSYDMATGFQSALRKVQEFIDTLEVKGVDLEKEYEEFVVDDPIFGNFITNDTLGMELAKHFYELGLKAQKGGMRIMKYIDAEKLKDAIKQRLSNIKSYCLQPNHDKRFDVVPEQIAYILSIIDSIQQEQPANTDNLCSELADFLIRNDIQEEKAKSLANRIADEYGSKRYIDGLCDGLKEEQSEVLETKEVDVEKEIQSWIEDTSVNGYGYYQDDVYETAEHFYELGLKARKGE